MNLLQSSVIFGTPHTNYITVKQLLTV